MGIQAMNPTPRRVPTVSEPPLIGSIGLIQDDPLVLLKKMAAECGDIGRFHVGPIPVLVVNSPELVQAVLVDHADAFDKGDPLHRAVAPVARDGLFGSEGTLHRRQRKLMAPVFTPRQVAAYADTMVAYAERAQAAWSDGATLDIAQEMNALTMNIAGKVLFDEDVLGETDELGKAITLALKYVVYVIFHFVPVPLSWPTSRNERTRAAIGLIQERVQAMIEDRRGCAEQRSDLLSLLMRARDEAGEAMSDEQVRDEALTLFIAGHETTATALSWCIYLLAQHPDIYAKVQQEIDGVLQGRSPAYADLPRLPYTLQVIKEAMRLYPPGWLLNRRALRPLEIAGYQVRKGQLVMVSIYTIHRRPDYFPDPERFDPDRFLPENEKCLPRHAYVPFGAGPRICIGNHFALMEAHLLVATLMQRVAFESVPGQQIAPEGQLTLRQKPGFRAVLRRHDAEKQL